MHTATRSGHLDATQGSTNGLQKTVFDDAKISTMTKTARTNVNASAYGLAFQGYP